MRTKPSPALVVAFLALVVALSGTAVALKRGSVGPRALKTGAVRTSKIADHAVKTAKIAPGSILSELIAPNAVGTPQLADDSVVETKIADQAVNNVQLAPNSVGTAKLRSSAVTGAKVEDGSLTSADLGPAVTLSIAPPAMIPAAACTAVTASGPGAVTPNRNLLPVSTGAGWDDRLMVVGGYGRSDGSLIVSLCNGSAGTVTAAAADVTFLQL